MKKKVGWDQLTAYKIEIEYLNDIQTLRSSHPKHRPSLKIVRFSLWCLWLFYHFCCNKNHFTILNFKKYGQHFSIIFKSDFFNVTHVLKVEIWRKWNYFRVQTWEGSTHTFFKKTRLKMLSVSIAFYPF